MKPRGASMRLRGDVHFEHAWLTVERLSFGPSEPLCTLGTDDPPFSLDPLLPVDFHEGLMRWVERYAVARDLPTRAPFVPAWIVALAHALWNGAPATAAGEVLGWAEQTPDPPAYAAALVVVYRARRDAAEARALPSATARLRLLREAMRELGDAQGCASPDEAPHD